MTEIINMKIRNTSLTMADHDALTFNLSLEGDGYGVLYGGYMIGKGYLGAKEFHGSAKGIEALMRIMDTVGVERWEDLSGKYVRIVRDGWTSTISKIGNIIEDKWFDAEEFFSNDHNT